MSRDTVLIEAPKDMLALLEDNNRFIQQMRARIEKGAQRWLNSRDAAKYMGLSRSAIYLYKDQIGYSKLDSGLIFDVRDIDKFLEGRKKYHSL